MNKSHPFSIRIFVSDGDPDGLRLVERSNWNGQALIFPRSLLPKIKKRDAFASTGIYLLLGPQEEGDGEILYIGEGDPVRPRLENHFLKKDFWTRCAFFVTTQSRALNKAHVQYLEARLISLAQAAKRVSLENINNKSLPTLNEADQADMEVFLEHMLQILPLLGIGAFEMPAKRTQRKKLLHIEAKGLKATGYESTEGFVVCEGSQIVLEAVPSLSKNIETLRQKLLTSGVMVRETNHYRITQNYSFSSPSMAATVVMGRSANGRIAWKDESGQTLKTIQKLLSES